MKKIRMLGVCAILFMILALGIYSLTRNNELTNVKDIATDSKFENITYDKAENILAEDVLGVLTIDKIGLTATVKELSNNSILKEYIGHIEGTATYEGNVGLAAHNRGNKFSFFARINELKGGDILTYKTKFYTREYRVDNIQVIYETDWSLLENTEENKLTLITCVQNKSNQRLCVQATELM